MKSILVPTDFSPHSLSAVNYAAELAKATKLDIHLVHAIHVPIVDVNSPITLTEVLMDNARAMASKKLAQLAEELTEKFEVKVTTTSDFGLAADYIASIAAEQKIDLIVMGTSGASGFVDSILGSVTSAVIKHGTTPVMAIPALASYKEIKTTVLANDYKESIAQELAFVYKLVKKFGSRLDIISVEPSKQSYSQEIVVNEANIREIAIWDTSVYNGITTYLEQESADLLVLKHHERTFFQDLMHKSTTKEILRKSTIPLLIF
jgi:nucleotide-binding universal stress UspA family protein